MVEQQLILQMPLPKQIKSTDYLVAELEEKLIN